jgi:hypothetical protein
MVIDVLNSAYRMELAFLGIIGRILWNKKSELEVEAGTV